MVLSICEFCKKYYKTHEAWLRKRKRHFCSRKCSGKWQAENRYGKRHPQYKPESHKQKCEMCAKFFDPDGQKRTFCSRKCKGLASRGEKHGRSKTAGHTYGYIHCWLRKNYGYPPVCENFYCQKRSNTYEWSLLHGKDYEKKRENFWRLCKVCHSSYDRSKLIVSKKELDV